MPAFFIRRIFTTIITVVGAMTLLFAVIQIIPGDPATVMMGPRATPELIAEVNERMNLDEPLHVQLWGFLSNVLQGDLGRDVLNHMSVTSLVMGVLPHTIVLAVSSIALAALIGIPLGTYAAVARDSWMDRITGALSVSMITTPPFVSGLFLLLIFSLGLGWFPATGGGEPGNFLSRLQHAVLPTVALALTWVGYIARLVRTSVLEELTSDHVRTARAKGLRESRVVFKHVLRGALIPTVAAVGVGFGNLLGGAVLVEIVFNRPGLGFLIFNGIETRNYPIVQGGLIIAVFLYTAANLLADLSYAFIDPRLRRE